MNGNYIVSMQACKYKNWDIMRLDENATNQWKKLISWNYSSGIFFVSVQTVISYCQNLNVILLQKTRIPNPLNLCMTAQLTVLSVQAATKTRIAN